MTTPSDLSFRDFAGAIMQGDLGKATSVLAALLDLDADGARAAVAFFQQGMTSGPDFMMKAMGMRTAVMSGTEDDLRRLLVDCFGLEGDAVSRAVTAVLARFRPTAS
jgi:hypothetical protein